MTRRSLHGYELAGKTVAFDIPGIFRPNTVEDEEELPDVFRQIGHLLAPVAANQMSSVSLMASVDRLRWGETDPMLLVQATLESREVPKLLNLRGGAVHIGTGLMSMGRLVIGQSGEAPVEEELVRIEHDGIMRELRISGLTDDIMLISRFAADLRDFQG
jgi:hypothetical protein